MHGKRIKAFITDMIFYIFASAVYSVAVLLFLSGNEISPGGLTGIATMLNYLFALPVGTVVFVLNIPLLILGFMKFGGIFIVKTAISTVTMSLVLDIASGLLPKLKLDSPLAAVFGGLLMGFSISLFLLRGSTTGGVDIIAKLINSKFTHLTVGRLILLADTAVIALSCLVYKNIESALYSVIALYASSKITDAMLYGEDRGKIIFIVTEEAGRVSQAVMSLVKRGVTLVSVTGAYTGATRKMLICTVRINETAAVLRAVREHDKNAFTIISDAGEIIGEGFKQL